MKLGITFRMIQSNLALTADYISILLLSIAGVVNLRSKKRDRFIVRCLGIYILYNVQGIYLENGGNMGGGTSKS